MSDKMLKGMQLEEQMNKMTDRELMEFTARRVNDMELKINQSESHDKRSATIGGVIGTTTSVIISTCYFIWENLRK